MYIYVYLYINLEKALVSWYNFCPDPFVNYWWQWKYAYTKQKNAQFQMHVY
jgi:hypothetical protein